MKNYHELHCHSHYSVGDSIIKIPDLIKRTKELGGNTVALTDHGTLGGIYELYKECKKENIKPIVGVEAYFVDKWDSEEANVPYNYGHITLIAKNQEGWDNLKQIQSQAWQNGFLRRPRVEVALLEKYSSGIICMTGCMRGLIGWNMIKEFDKYNEDLDTRMKIVQRRLKLLKAIFEDDFYFEYQLIEMPEQEKVNKYIFEMAHKFDGKRVITGDVHYLHKKDYKYHDIMICYNRKKKLTDEDNGTYPTHEIYLKNYELMRNTWQAYHDSYISEDVFESSIESTEEIVSKIEGFKLKPDKVCIPEFTDTKEEFEKSLAMGWENILTEKQKKSKTYKERLEYEKGVISKLKMESYMCVCADIIKKAKTAEIPVGPGRGSVCGSLVAYLMGITEIDPIRFGIIFERFLTPDRLSLPDIDMDFGKNKRELLKQKVREFYGEEKFASIITYQDWKPRNLIKDIGKVLGYDFQEMNTLTKKIDDKTKRFDDDEVPMNPEVLDWLNNNVKIFDPAKRLQALYRSKGVHASGMILTPTQLEEWVPTAFMIEGGTDEMKPTKVSEWDMYALEDLNILKIDFLGLQTLDVIYMTVDLINKKNKIIDNVWKTCLDDLDNEKVFELINAGNIAGMFQLETSEGMSELIKKVKPTSFYDIVMIISLYRTAVIQAGMMDEYIKRRNGEEFEYVHPIVRPVLGNTYGVLVFQEQLMEIAVVAAGLSRSESDNFRKATKLKDVEKFKAWENRFIEGCAKNGLSEDEASTLWQWCVKFSGYGFNISHATAYALITYTTAWLKAFYPKEFMVSLMTYNADDKDMMPKYLTECKKMKLQLLKPNINLSKRKFVIHKEKMLQPLTMIHGVGDKVLHAIFHERKNGKFKSFENFLDRIDKRVCNIRVLVNLVLSGAFNKFGTLEEIYEQLIDSRNEKCYRQYYCKDCEKRYPCNFKIQDVEAGVTVCLNCSSPKISVKDDDLKDSKFDKGWIQNQVYGYMMLDNPLKKFVDVIAKYDVEYLSKIQDYDDSVLIPVVCFVKNIKKYVDKKGGEMAFVDISDGEFDCSLTIFSSAWGEVKKDLIVGHCYMIVARKNRGDNLMWIDRGPNKSRLIRLGI